MASVKVESGGREPGLHGAPAEEAWVAAADLDGNGGSPPMILLEEEADGPGAVRLEGDAEAENLDQVHHPDRGSLISKCRARGQRELPSGYFLNCGLNPTGPRFPAMGEDTNRRWRYRRREAEEPKAGFAVVAYPPDAKIGIKQIAYLHAYCGLQPHLIAAKYPKVLTLSDVHLALAHYFRDPTAIDAGLKQEFAFNARDGLGSPSMCMPRRDVGSD